MATIRVLTWNLFHGRDGGSAGGRRHRNRKYYDEVAAVIRERAPDLVMLQEVPPLAIARIASGYGAEGAWSVLTSPRIGPVALRGRLGERNPDLWRTHEGNANVILAAAGLSGVGGSATAIRLNPPRMVLAGVRRYRLGWREAANWALEARKAVTVRLVTAGGATITAVCVHHHPGADPRQVGDEMARLGAILEGIPGPLVLGGDINAPPDHPGFAGWRRLGLHDGHTDAGIGIDRILVRGLDLVAPPRRLDGSVREITVPGPTDPGRVLLSDHDPVEAEITVPG